MGFRDVGYLRIATNDERVHEMRRTAPFMQRFGIDCHEVAPREAQELFPIGDLSDVKAAFYIAEDGRVNPVYVTMSLAKGPRMGGARIFEDVRVTTILSRNGMAKGVRLEDWRAILTESRVTC